MSKNHHQPPQRQFLNFADSGHILFSPSFARVSRALSLSLYLSLLFTLFSLLINLPLWDVVTTAPLDPHLFFPFLVLFLTCTGNVVVVIATPLQAPLPPFPSGPLPFTLSIHPWPERPIRQRNYLIPNFSKRWLSKNTMA